MADGIGGLVVSIQADLARFDSDLKRVTSMTQRAMGNIENLAGSAARSLVLAHVVPRA